ncbi:hypothetical protein LUZ61_019883 [Rhynchospora tenuis]|uniref:Calcineurin-like phosphoesterase domain-containing protein n=1 Tax=Rhynchospora tenuis TaxID=198213 RepID=A0AAD5ZCA4_9POAL|nr:hypothetical protein LUZ61_019883 [Rhynchospora tenuis]
MEINLSNRTLFFCFLLITTGMATTAGLRFDNKSGEFKIVQVADMHYANGRWTGCLDVFPDQVSTCSDLNTTDFLYRIIRAENPDLVVFTGDNIYGHDTIDPVKSMNMAFDPVVALKLPWAAVLGNHDQESYLSREAVMRHITTMPYTLSRLNPNGSKIDGYGNYNIEISGPEGSPLVNKSVLNLYFLDSGDYSKVQSIHGYGWIKLSQQVWFQKTSLQLQKVYKRHDHLNDFCGNLTGIQLCYAGGFGYHASGKAGWPRRTRVVSAFLEKTADGQWGGVESIKTWKRLDDQYLSARDPLVYLKIHQHQHQHKIE